MNLVRQTQTGSSTLTRRDQEGAQSISTSLSLAEVALLDLDNEPLLDLDNEPLTDIGSSVVTPFSFTNGEVAFTTSGVMILPT